MKFIRLATIAALTATIFVGGITAFADEVRNVTTDGTIEFTPNEDEDLVVVPPET
ncbi:WxL domain-containing protein, partial [Enterococcus mundtii]|nr:WxL domain-containing protein [Enterococcus mundtii]